MVDHAVFDVFRGALFGVENGLNKPAAVVDIPGVKPLGWLSSPGARVAESVTFYRAAACLTTGKTYAHSGLPFIARTCNARACRP